MGLSSSMKRAACAAVCTAVLLVVATAQHETAATELGTSAAAPDTHPNVGKWAEEKASNYPGNDIRPCASVSADAACKTECLHDTKCVGYFYDTKAKTCCVKYRKGNVSTAKGGAFYNKPAVNAEPPKPSKKPKTDV